MKEAKLIIHNESKLPLNVSTRKYNNTDHFEFVVESKSSLDLKSGQYNVALYYPSAKLQLESNMRASLNIAHILLKSQEDYFGKVIEVNNPSEPIIIKCSNIN